LPTLIRFPEDNTLAKPDARRLAAAQRGARNRTRLASTSRTATTVQQLGREDTTSVLDHPSSIFKERTTKLIGSRPVERDEDA